MTINKCIKKKIWFVPERFTIEAISILKRLIESFREKNRDLHIYLLDLQEIFMIGHQWR